MSDSPKRYNVLVLGAGYGSLFAIKLLMAGHAVTLCCTPEECRDVATNGLRVRFPLARVSGELWVDSRTLEASLNASPPGQLDPARFDLVVLAMQEPHYSAPEMRALLERVGAAEVPCLSIMNMPPLTFLSRLPGIDLDACSDCYRDAALWQLLPAGRVSHASADAQASRRGDGALEVGLPSNFWIAPFAHEADNRLLLGLAADVNAIRATVGNERVRVPVRLGIGKSVARPLAKWPMLLAGNYRCVEADSERSIAEAVVQDMPRAREVYDWVAQLCLKLGAADGDLVRFDDYASAAATLGRPSSVARSLAAGAVWIERTDRLVQALAAQRGQRFALLDERVELVDQRLARNRANEGRAAAS